MSLLLLSIASMTIATLAVHLGLFRAIIGVVTKIASCAQCASFWFCLASLLAYGEAPIVVDVMISIIIAYMSNYLVLLLVYINNKYDELWQKLKK